MKKSLLFLLFILTLNQAYAYITQGNYRWRNDDGTESTATWKAAENTPIILASKTEKIRFRFNLIGDDTDPVSTTLSLYYTKTVGSTTTSGVQITTASTADFMLAGNNANVTDGQATTSQMAGTGTFVPGKMVTSTGSPSIILNPGQRTEYEWLLQPGSTIEPNAQYQFYLQGPNIISSSINTLTTSSTLPLTLVSFTAQPSGNKILLKWTTTQEVDVSRFEIEKGPDGTNFSTIGTVPVSAGSGVKKYSYLDNAPFTSENYYRLKIMDEDGTFHYSNIYRTKPGETKNTSLKIFPNPVKDRLNIRLTAPEGPVQIFLHDVSGRTLKVYNLHSDGLEMSAAAETSSLLPGIYFIKFGNEVLQFLKD